MCLLDYFKPSGWNEQLECVELTCFKGPDAAADVATFFSMNIVIGRFAAIMDATLNSRSGKRFFKAPKTGAVSSKGRTKDPISGKAIDNVEPESASMGNPMYEFDFASAWDDFAGTTAADQCSKCFVCKVIFWPHSNPIMLHTHYIQVTSSPHGSVCAWRQTLDPNQVPELRLLWWLIASIGSLISPSNFATYAGNVTDNCQTNGSWYIDACGPWGAELLPYKSWRSGGYTAAIAEMDTRIFDAYAAGVIDLNARIGAGRDATFAEFVQAAHQWQSVDPLNMRERALAFVYHSCRNMRAEARENGLVYDTPERYHSLESGSVGRTSSHFLYDTSVPRSNTCGYTHIHTRTHARTRLPQTGAVASSTRSSPTRAGGCTTWATSLPRAARTRCSARRTRSSA